MAQPFPSPIHSMSAIHGCLLCSLAYLLADMALTCFWCPFLWWIVSILPALLIFWHITQIPANDRDTYPRPASELLRNVATCEARTHFWWILNSSRPANFIEVVGKNDSGSAAVSCYKLGTFANKNILRWSTRWPALHIEVFLVTFLAYCALP